MTRPAVIPPPRSILQLKRGFDILAKLLALTLGPTQGIVLASTDLQPRPEVLTDAATIARRITELPDPEQNVGLMLLRNLVWRMHERVGDGGALAAVLAQAILEHALRSVRAGANPVLVANGIRRAAQDAIQHLTQISQPVQGEADLVAVAYAATGEEKLSWVLGEMFDLLGPRAYIQVEEYVAPYLERVYQEGGRWQAELISPYLVSAPTLGRAVQQDCRVALYDGTLSSQDEVRPLLELAGGQQPARLLLCAQRVSSDALNLLVATHLQTELKIVAVSLTRTGEQGLSDLNDLALLSGARVVSPVLGRRLDMIRLEDLGLARRVEASAQELFMVGNADAGQGAASYGAELRREIELLSQRLQALPIGDDGRPELEMRLGRLSGSAGVLKVGAISQPERDYLHQRAEQGVKILRATLEEGVLPGGGCAYLHCIGPAQAQLPGMSGDEAMGVRALALALQAPFAQILRNAGEHAPALHAQQILDCPVGYFYDVLKGQVRLAREAGVLDSTRILRAALETAVSGALMALSTDTLVIKRKPKVSYEP
jgi:chaperonin GroEL